MKRLVYSPKVFAYVKTDRNDLWPKGIVNVSDYIVSGGVTRKVGVVSSAELTIRNPDMIWTREARKGRPVFRPMDPITIWLQRLRGHPVQVFTGYLDRSPYLQLFPGTCTLAASCTLKRLLYTFWDPALQFTNQFMRTYGWYAQPNGLLKNIPAETQNTTVQKLVEGDRVDPIYRESLIDGSIGNVLFAVLKHVAEWDPKAIHIEQLPPRLIERIGEIYDAYNEDAKVTKKMVEAFLKKIIGEGNYGSGGGSGGGEVGELKGGTNIEKAYNYFRDTIGFTENQAAGAVGSIRGESINLDPKVTEKGGGGGYGICQWTGGRRSALEAKAGHDTLGVQLRFILEELRGSESAAMTAMKGTKSVEAACRTWTSTYERPGIPRISERIQFAREVKKSFAGGDGESKVGGSTEVLNARGETVTKERTAANPSSKESSEETKIYAPIKGSPPMGAGSGSDFGPRNVTGGSKYHLGIDVPTPAGTPCIAPFDGEVSVPISGNGFGGHGGMIHLRALEDTAGLKRGQIIGWGHIQSARVKSGRVKAGTHIADSGWHHVHFVLRDGPGGADGTRDPEGVYKALAKGEQAPASGAGSDPDSEEGTGSYADVLSTAKAAAFVQQLEWPSAAETMEAVQLTGHRSLMNDKPLFPFIEQLSNASLRNFQSLPNGNFYAFYPDYFGQFDGRKPYWHIDDIEILDAQIELTDEALATHVFAVADTVPSMAMGEASQIDWFERVFSTGIVNIYNVTQSGFNPDSGIGEDTKRAKEIQKERLGRIASDPTQVVDFLKKYGARPHVEEAAMVRSPFLEHFIAYQTFQRMWANLFLTNVEFTFMPELYPGGLVGFPNHGLQCYVDEVVHTFDYENGFTTSAQLSAPASLDSNKLATDPLSFGLVRAEANKGPERSG